LLINTKTVELIEEPALVDLYEPQPARVAMKCKIAPFVGSVVKSAVAAELWINHSPSSDAIKFGIEARRGVFDTVTGGDVRAIAGGDFNMSRFQAEFFNYRLREQLRWKITEPAIPRHGDLVLHRNVDVELVPMKIGRSYEENLADKSSDNHNACAIVFTSTVERGKHSEMQATKQAPVVPSLREEPPSPSSSEATVSQSVEAALQPSQLETDLATHAEVSDDVTKEIVLELLRFLWWGPISDVTAPLPCRKGTIAYMR